MERKLVPKLSTPGRFGPKTLNEAERTVEVTWSTGAPVTRRDAYGNQFVEELSMDESAIDLSRFRGAPLLQNHNNQSLDDVIGKVEMVRLANGIGTATIRFASDEISDRTFTKIREGILDSVSVGYRITEMKEVSSRSDEIPRYMATKWQPLELSVVGLPADPNAKIRTEQNEPNEVQITRAESAENGNTMSDKNEILKAERARVLEIRQAVRSAKLDESFADEMIERGVSADQARTMVLAEMAKGPFPAASVGGQLRVEVGSSNRAGKLEQAAEALAFRINPSLKPKENSEFVGRTMVQILERSLVERKLGMSNEQVVARAMSTDDFPQLLANVAEKVAAARYALQPKNWSKFAATDTLRNFKTANIVRGGDFPSLVETLEGAEATAGSFGESKEQVQLKSWARVVSMTRRAIINDDLGQLSLVANDAGTSAARLENKLVFNVLKDNALMADGYALFSANHSNLGTGAAISDTSIGEAMKLMRQQMSVDGLDQLNLSPKYMIVGPESESLARKYLTQINPTQATNVNPWAGMLELIVDSEINSNDFYFAADPQMARGVVLFRLEGQESPRIQAQTDFRTDSVEIKCAHDAAAAAIDYRPLVKNANAS